MELREDVIKSNICLESTPGITRISHSTTVFSGTTLTLVPPFILPILIVFPSNKSSLFFHNTSENFLF